MLETIQAELNQGVRKLAENSLLKKLNTQGIQRIAQEIHNKIKELNLTCKNITWEKE